MMRFPLLRMGVRPSEKKTKTLATILLLALPGLASAALGCPKTVLAPHTVHADFKIQFAGGPVHYDGQAALSGGKPGQRDGSADGSGNPVGFQDRTTLAFDDSREKRNTRAS